jgi:N-acetylmuramoyl-L-alanine amidase
VQFAKAVLKIKVDPGHAGKYNRGAVSGYWEPIQVWKLSNYLTPYLKKIPGIKATMTKSNLYSDPLVYNRGKMAKGNDLFLSIHSNSSSSSSTDYPLTIVSYSKRHLYTIAQPLGVALSKAVRTTMKTRQAHQVWVKKQSDGRDWYGVIRGSSDVGVPGIIIEHSFHSNPTRAAWLMKNANLKKMAAKETTVISSYYGLNANGTVAKPAVPADFKVTAGKGKITVSRKNSPVTGVMVYRSTKSTGGFKLIDTTSKLSYSNIGLKAGKTYYYKIRAYRCNGKKIAYSAYTKVLGATVK